MKMKEYFISVIVPIYNAENYIKRVVESLLKQTTDEIEIILVDDGSTDQSLMICNRYDSIENVTVIHKENGGICSARNIGLQHAKGKYISFVDADDFMDETAYEKIIKCLIKTNADILDFGWRYISETGEKTENLNENKKNILFDKKYIKDVILPPLLNLKKDEEHFIYDFSCMKVFKKDIIDQYNIRFDESRRVWEDRIFLVEYLKYSRNYYCMDECFYNYVSIPNSLSRRYNSKFLELILKNYNLYIDLFGNEYDFSGQYVIDYWCNSIENMVMEQLKVKNEHEEVVQNIKNILKKEQVQFWYQNRTLKNEADKKLALYVKKQEYSEIIKLYEKIIDRNARIEERLRKKQKIKNLIKKVIHI